MVMVTFTWVWLAAAVERTKKMKFITGVTAAVYRYNPGIIAQAFASLYRTNRPGCRDRRSHE
jgi:alkanesulfonate monooxygenase SsuD/methylene tetrahydromethanopterin reductase-like flavin-dependent oxidoreductase (luciferase family)